MTRPIATTGGPSQSASRGARNTRHNSNCDAMQSALNLSLGNSVSFPPNLHRLSARALLKRGYVTQALIDSTAVLFCFLFLLSVALSIPLAIFLLLFARF